MAPWLDLRAGGISDPLKRLRFLRHKMAEIASKELARPVPEVKRTAFVKVAASCVLIPLFLPFPKSPSSSTVKTTDGERRLALPSADIGVVPTLAQVWLVEQTPTLESYSNGLRIDLTFAVTNRPRHRFPVFPINGGVDPSQYETKPMGIVYHSTESHLAPFEEAQNARLRQLGRNLLENVRRERSYHYVIDRFGRVFREVEETGIANHAGHSVWADAHGIYVNLNAGFLGVALEGRSGEADSLTSAQVSASRTLTEMLRSRYRIAAENCVTHAQVSVNPSNMQLGYHVDWAAGFPFAALGLPNNYAQPPASVWAFGFDSPPALIDLSGGEWTGLASAER